MTTRQINPIRKILDDIPYINEGGCGVAALAMYRWLEKKELLDNPKFIYGYKYTGHAGYINNSLILKDNVLPEKCACLDYPYPQSASHVALENAGLIFCTEKYYDSYEDLYKYYNVIDNVDYVVQTLNDGILTWNSYFNRSKYIPEIENKLGISLSDIILFDY